jgi:lipopolysaccharide transport system ATP-binding protein
LRRQETARRFDEIVEFAEVGPFIDTPVKRYSNGMNARLGFSIAAHLDPQVLIIDEVLSVGDLAFQERCLQRMLEFKRRGSAIVFVSHNISAVAALCDRVMVIAAGRTRFAGATATALDHYLQMSHGDADAKNGVATFERIVLTDARDHPVAVCAPGAALRITAHLRFHRPIQAVSFGLAVFQTDSGVCAYSVESHNLGRSSDAYEAAQSVEITFALDAHLTRGHYLLELYAKAAGTDVIVARSHPAAFLRVTEAATTSGVADLGARCRVRVLPDAASSSSSQLVSMEPR